ncbi:NAD(P)/FAD-dependent oxidoreductase [Rhodococcus sp. BP-149]|uniref:phytoene desaturase family protein n=1 Tax=unclassified Rhodococcus (in: high G+C Gram-positive bacteria) TaxID=192944 RepID=UPI00068B661C|nr:MULTISPECIES: NAD(P)/FAD-dependent oxidoreductase [unclassified Rhodococcus (in: high G+C Gram-positive bacteria)]KQU30561.1 FAD-dependent oxidoreductase [Rhodococcus sp. Leaf225]KQU44536.1 FAD-dependent oxidoreductase [Rhodococcus sp. Leaf258]MBY6681108.1 NAD(P)/FAD-dependent oxidoreductase [Rhodococcus sp. BP-316]MBY6686025.1 NAD(P)/FAD-dependent oxidoreductase [Rhodococcus sp. BP-288]MBY6696096.1 NAD(P)/FAD-dependent oxidoreductase [Rhodococcus sp. BP-188]
MIDAAVVGSGHNALVSAAYLTDAGWSVRVLERDTVVGGAASTVERFPGHKVDRGSSAHIMIRQTGIIEELRLADHGLRYLDCDPWAFAPPPPGTDEPGIVFSVDLDATCASIEAACGRKDADAYRAFVALWGPRSARVMTSFGSPPTGRALLSSFWGMDASDGAAALSREFLASGDSLLNRWFDSERLKAALAWFGAQSGPPMSEPGTAPMVAFNALMHTTPPGRAVGGSGALSVALQTKIEADGGTVTLGDAVVSVTRVGDGWSVRTASGEEVRARTVIAGCHILTTLDLLDAGGFDTATTESWRRQIDVGPGIGMVVRASTSSLPQYPGAPGVESSSRGLQLLVHDRAQLRRAHGAASAGDLPPAPVVLAMSFSAVDPSIAKPGEHQVSLWSQWHPYRLADGRSWRGGSPEVAELEGDRIVAEVDKYAPGFADSILQRHTQSPWDLEQELGLVGGNVMHVEMSLHQMMMWRPMPALADMTVPGAPSFFLTGASMHPGGGVSGSSGRSAARLAIAERAGSPLKRVASRLGAALPGRR